MKPKPTTIRPHKTVDKSDLRAPGVVQHPRPTHSLHSEIGPALYPTPTEVKSLATTWIRSQTPINLKQCIQVTITGALTQATCELPIYCGEIRYFKVNSSWWGTETGVCVGFGEAPMVVTVNKQYLVPFGWDMIVNSESNTNCDSTMEILWNDRDGYSVISPVHAEIFPKYNMQTGEFMLPTLSEFQGKYCIKYASESKCPIRIKANPAHSICWIHTKSRTPVGDFSPAFYQCYRKVGGTEKRLTLQTITCNPASTTTKVWPTVITSLPSVISSALIIVFVTLLQELKELLLLALKLIMKTVDIPSLVLTFYVTTKFTRNLLHSLVAALVTSIGINIYLLARGIK